MEVLCVFFLNESLDSRVFSWNKMLMTKIVQHLSFFICQIYYQPKGHFSFLRSSLEVPPQVHDRDRGSSNFSNSPKISKTSTQPTPTTIPSPTLPPSQPPGPAHRHVIGKNLGVRHQLLKPCWSPGGFDTSWIPCGNRRQPGKKRGWTKIPGKKNRLFYFVWEVWQVITNSPPVFFCFPGCA